MTLSLFRNCRSVVIVVLPSILTGCRDDETFSLKGFVTFRGVPLADVIVSIDEKSGVVITGQDGGFIINAPEGQHLLRLHREFPASEFGSPVNVIVERTFQLAVAQSSNLLESELPEPSIFLLKTVGAYSAKFVWTKTDIDSFQNYFVFRSERPNVSPDDQLVYSSASRSDTTFLDTGLSAEKQYYYRLYIKENSSLSSSNELSVYTPVPNPIANPGFEQVNDDHSPLGWTTIYNVLAEGVAITEDSNVSAEGNSSLKFSHVTDGGCWMMQVLQFISYTQLEPGKDYKLMFKHKADFSTFSSVDIQTIYKDQWDGTSTQFKFDEHADWTTVEGVITVPADLGTNDLQIMITYCIPVTGHWWLDDIHFQKIN